MKHCNLLTYAQRISPVHKVDNAYLAKWQLQVLNPIEW